MPTIVSPEETVSQKPNGESPALDLCAMQAAFQRAILLGDDAVLNDILDTSRTNRNVLFGVYRHAYVARLIEVVRSEHPLLHRHLGDDAFAELAKAYIVAEPSRHPNARWFAHRLPDHLSQSQQGAPHLAELAALERALNDAFDAPDVPALELSDLAAIPPQSWSDLVFNAHPSAHSLAFTTNAHARWLALKNEQPPPAVELRSAPECVIVWRHETIPKVRRMSDEEAMMWNEVSNGIPFGRLCELIAVYDDPETAPLRAAQHLQGWILSGLLAKSMPG